MKDGIVNVMKPPGITSHDAVNRLRKVYHTKKVGHTGTLDPDALGVLPVCVGQATRLAEYLVDKDKEYRAMLKFGLATDTEDNSGKIIARAELPKLSREEFVTLTQQFVGEIMQTPPMYSAIKKNGQPLYKLARAGVTVEPEPRSVRIHSIEVLMYNETAAMLNVRCGKGTYMRTLCADLAKAAGSVGHMCYLMRNQSGPFRIEDAIRLDALEASAEPEKYLIPMTEALKDVPLAVVRDETVKSRIQNGLAQKLDFAVALAEGDLVQAQDEEGNLLALGYWCEARFQPHKVFKVGENDENI